MIPEYVKHQAKCELARRSIWEYSKLRHPDFYKEDRTYLKMLCDEIQSFIEEEGKDKKFLLLNMPPRIGKTFTVKNTCEWLFGNNPKNKIMTGSYNEILSGIFAKQILNTIQEEKTDNRIIYNDIFPNTKIKYGEARANIWALEKQDEKSFLATSPTASATGMGCKILIIDDLIKNDMEAYNELVLEKHWNWFCFEGNTNVSTLNGQKKIKDIQCGDMVLTYNHLKNKIEEKEVLKTKSKLSEVYRLEFEDGKIVETTGNHKFYTNRGYKSVEEILSIMWGRIEEGKTVLFSDLQEQSEKTKITKSKLLKLWGKNKYRKSKQTEDVLFYKLSSPTPNEKLKIKICNVEQNKRRIKRKIQSLSKMWNEEQFTCSPYRQKHKKQRVEQLDCCMPIMPFRISQATKLSKKKIVYDIEVDENHNFFANDILVHNCNTMLSRLEGNDWLVIVIQTRWSENDLSGRLLQSEYKDLVKQITLTMVQEDGSMLCDEIMNRETYELKIKEMNPDIAEANYNQKLIDMKNRLYGEFKVWEELPRYNKKCNYTDTADTGEDYYCSINYVEYEKEVYITDILFTQDSMDITEDKTADLLFLKDVNEAVFESNNGGRYFSKKVADRIKQKYNSNKCVIRAKTQRNNKESRILANATWVNEHIYMPFNWQHKYPEFYKHIKNFMRKGKNIHDDGADVLTAIAESINNKPKIMVSNSRIM